MVPKTKTKNYFSNLFSNGIQLLIEKRSRKHSEVDRKFRGHPYNNLQRNLLYESPLKDVDFIEKPSKIYDLPSI